MQYIIQIVRRKIREAYAQSWSSNQKCQTRLATKSHFFPPSNLSLKLLLQPQLANVKQAKHKDKRQYRPKQTCSNEIMSVA